MSKTFILLSAFWFIWELKYVLFWLYLWQLKEYHVGRFIDHFRTAKGKKLIFSYEQILKLFLLILLILDQGLLNPILYLALILYFAELVLFLKVIFNKALKTPKKTLKTLILIVASFAVAVLFLFWVARFKALSQLALLLGFDILTPIIISVVVLLFQPAFVFFRNNILKKAAEKIERINQSGQLKVIVITGSYGKTSTKEFLSTILSKKFKVLKTNNHQNSEIGIARCILDNLNSSHQIFIAEVGAYNKEKVKEVCAMIKPEIGIVTGVNEQHLALFGSLENLLSAEGGGELVDALPKSGLLVVNGDNKYCLDLYRRANIKKKIYSLDTKITDSDLWSESITVSRDGVSFLTIDRSGNLNHFGVKVLGKQNVQNLLGAILVAREFGMSFEDISDACKDISQEAAGMTIKNGKHGIDIIDSSYSSNPDGVFAELDYLSIFHNKKVIIMPCLIELGDKSSKIHSKIGKKIGKVCDLAIITTEDKFKEIKNGAMKSGMDEKNIILCSSPQDIYSIVSLFCKPNGAVLLEGRVPPGLIDLLKS